MKLLVTHTNLKVFIKVHKLYMKTPKLVDLDGPQVK